MQERKVNRLNSTSLIRPMIDEHWESLRKAKERGQKTVWCAGVPSILTAAMGIPTHLMPGFGSYCAATKGIEPLLEAAEADGQLIETCSYHRLHMGLLALHRKQLPIREDLRLPVPDLMVVPRGCTEQSHYADAVHRYSGVPVVCIDMPPPHRDSDIPSNIAYMERQLKEEAIPAIEKLLGRPYDFDKLSEMMATVKQVGLLCEECLALNKNIPAPWTLVDIAVSLGPVTVFPGKPGTVEFYQAVKAELEERVKNKVGALPTEKYRLYWDAMLMWGWLGMISRRFASWDGVLVAGRYPWEFWPYPERIEPSEPLRSLAEQLILMFHKQPPQNAIPYLTGIIKDYSIDGAVIFSPRTCRLFGIAAPELANYVVRKLGVPTVVIDADVVDPKFFSEAQVNTRLQALFEMMEAKESTFRGSAVREFRFVAGVDVGSLCTKALIWDANQKIVSYNIIRSGALFREAAETCLAEALRLAGLKSSDIDYIVSTGYGRANVQFANDQVTELTCHARGARHFCPDVHTVIDIGGQDSKVIHINDQGQVENFVMNDKCAAGTGRFLEVMAGALQVNLEELGELSLRSQIEVVVSSMCTVFAESEVISLFAAGHNQADIAAAVHRAIARRIVGMVGQIGSRGKVAMTGGVAKNIGVVRALEKKLATAILVPTEPQINGALGAAIIAAERVSALACK